MVLTGDYAFLLKAWCLGLRAVFFHPKGESGWRLNVDSVGEIYRLAELLNAG